MFSSVPSSPPSNLPRSSWWSKFACALRGVRVAVAGHSSFLVHFTCTVGVIAAAIVLRVGLLEWCILLGCVSSVLTAEMFNTVLETLVRATAPGPRPELRDVLDIAAGAVLLSSVGAALIGGAVFVRAIITALVADS